MVHGQVLAGGSEALLELIDEFGEAIEFDLDRFQSSDILGRFFAGEVHPAAVVRRLRMLPHNSAFAAHLAALPRSGPSRPEPWREHYAYNDTAAMVRAVWSLLEVKFAGKKAKGFPEPGAGRGKPLSSFAPRTVRR